MDQLKTNESEMLASLSASELATKLWVYIVPLEKKQNELCRIQVAGKIMHLRFYRVSVNATKTDNIRCSVLPNLETTPPGNFGAMEFRVSGMSGDSLIEALVHIPSLKKGDEFRISSSWFPYGFKKLTIKKYDQHGNLKTIHEQTNVPRTHYVSLNWP